MISILSFDILLTVVILSFLSFVLYRLHDIVKRRNIMKRAREVQARIDARLEREREKAVIDESFNGTGKNIEVTETNDPWNNSTRDTRRQLLDTYY